jgi:hypothetical protein
VGAHPDQRDDPGRRDAPRFSIEEQIFAKDSDRPHRTYRTYVDGSRLRSEPCFVGMNGAEQTLIIWRDRNEVMTIDPPTGTYVHQTLVKEPSDEQLWVSRKTGLPMRFTSVSADGRFGERREWVNLSLGPQPDRLALFLLTSSKTRADSIVWSDRPPIFRYAIR